MRPRVGITSGLSGPHWHAEGMAWRAYATAVQEAGGEAVHLDPATTGREREVVADLQALLLTGGQDVDLSMYPNPPSFPDEDLEAVMARFHMRPEAARDAYELPLLREALEQDLAVLGICRGCQVLNVGLGGRLILDIPTETDTRLRHHTHPAPDGQSSYHTVQIAPDSLLAEALCVVSVRECNSRHHQAVRLDDTFAARVAALSPEDGLIEAIEVPSRRWAVGVQWHPEHPGDPHIRELYRPLFRAFIAAAS